MSIQDTQKTTDFGFKSVSADEKSSLVAQVFTSVAKRYDLMNDVLSFGMHRLWKLKTISAAHIKPGQNVLDVAAGTGDLAYLMLKALAHKGSVTITDINSDMLSIGRNRLCDAGFLREVHYVEADAEKLPFIDNHFDLITIAFGLRNITDKLRALKSLFRVLKPGGKLLVLEFSHVENALLNKLYDVYSLHFIPKLGEWIANDEASYQYLVESIRQMPNQAALASLMEAAGFEDVSFENLSNGIVALHSGFKY